MHIITLYLCMDIMHNFLYYRCNYGIKYMARRAETRALEIFAKSKGKDVNNNNTMY